MQIKEKVPSWFWQIFSYFFVGGGAAIVEWVTFYLFDSLLHGGYLLATALSFVIATFTNWVLGRLLTFRKAAKKSKEREILGVYAVSAVGLLFNLGLMYIFVDCLAIPDLASKILSTGIVFFWNFISRKLFIYKI